MPQKKEFVLGTSSGGEPIKPFVLNWAVPSGSTRPVFTDVYADTAFTATDVASDKRAEAIVALGCSFKVLQQLDTF